MKVLSEEKIRLVAEKNGWSLAYAEGFIEGVAFRQRDKTPSAYTQVGIDEYSLGFRTGYYERKTTEGQPITPTVSASGKPIARSLLKKS
jgi:hypothetical protein